MIDRKTQTQDQPRQQPDINGDGTAAIATPVIALDDRTTGPEAENGRLLVLLGSLRAEVDKLRSENQKLTADKQALNTELLEMKLAMSKLQVDELRGLERGNSWLRPFKMLL